jgi:AraC-like DNA-binding protein
MVDRTQPRPSAIHKDRRFFAAALGKALKAMADMRVIASQENSHPPLLARIAANFRCSLVLTGRHRQQTDLGNGAQDICLTPGDVFLMREGTWRLPLFGTAQNILVFQFSSTSIFCSQYEFREGSPKTGYKERHFSTSRALTGAGAFLLNAVIECTKQIPFPSAYRPLVRCLLEQVLEILRNDAEPLGKSEMTFHTVCNYVREHFRNPISRESVADALHIHPAHISRLFRSIGTTTFQEYLQRVRVEYAAKLLGDASLSVKEVAVSSGFQSTDYFREVFCKLMGESPRAHRSAEVRTRLSSLSADTPALQAKSSLFHK